MPKNNWKRKKSNDLKSNSGPKDKTSSKGSVSEIPKLLYNKKKSTGNLTTWANKLFLHVGNNFGRAQDFIEDGSYYVPPVVLPPDPDVVDPSNDPFGVILKSYQKAVGRREAMIADLTALIYCIVAL